MTTCWCRASSGDKNAIGYFGFAYYVENKGKLQDVAVEGVAPTAGGVDAGKYKLARPLFIYSDAKNHGRQAAGGRVHQLLPEQRR